MPVPTLHDSGGEGLAFPKAPARTLEIIERVTSKAGSHLLNKEEIWVKAKVLIEKNFAYVD